MTGRIVDKYVEIGDYFDRKSRWTAGPGGFPHFHTEGKKGKAELNRSTIFSPFCGKLLPLIHRIQRVDKGRGGNVDSFCNDIFNHTSLCQYRHGKLLLHLILPFEKRPKGNQPGEYLRYYRLRNNLTTRQLAEQIGIVPVTLLKYEQGITPIPYDTAVRLSERLKIDEELLCDSFAAFIASPYTEALKAIREELKLNQREFAELVGLKASYYYQMEKGNRRLSRKVYQQIMDALNAKQSTNFT